MNECHSTYIFLADTQNALLILCARGNDFDGMKTIWDSMKEDPLNLQLRTTKYEFFFWFFYLLHLNWHV